MIHTKDQIQAWLEEVMDPEIPTISIVDLGIVTDIRVEQSATDSSESIWVELTPTFSGCPALKIMEQLVKDKLHEKGLTAVEVETNFKTQWNTNMISEKGLAALQKHGLAPPPRFEGYLELDVLSDTPCPYCGSRNTEMKTPFGPTLCRSMHYCKNCLNAFEGFKPVG